MGERYLRHVLPGKTIDSAGTGALIDHSADETAQYVASSNGVSLEGHKGKQFTSSMGRQYDLILVMEKKHIEEISHMAPEVRGKVMLFGHWLGQREISDPYKKSQEAFDLVYKLIVQAGNLWAEKLSN